MFPIYTNITYQDLHVDPILIDPFWFSFNLTKEVNKWNVEEAYVEMHLPLVQNWRAKALVTYELLWIPI